jgi:hypothetical protein
MRKKMGYFRSLEDLESMGFDIKSMGSNYELWHPGSKKHLNVNRQFADKEFGGDRKFTFEFRRSMGKGESYRELWKCREYNGNVSFYGEVIMDEDEWKNSKNHLPEDLFEI